MALAVSARRSRLLLVGLVLAHLAAISHQVDGGGGVSLLQRGLLGALSPLQRGVGAVVGGVGEAWRGWAFHRETYEENRRLEGRVRQLETELQARSFQAQEAAAAARAARPAPGGPDGHDRRPGGGPGRGAVVPHPHPRPGRGGRDHPRRPGHEPDRGGGARVRGRAARRARAGAPRPRRRGGRPRRAQPRARGGLRPGLGPGGRAPRTSSSSTCRSARTWWWETWW